MDLPHSEKDEAELLGACLKSKANQKMITKSIPLDAIFIQENFYIYKTIKELNKKGHFATFTKIWDYLKENKIEDKAGGYTYLSYISAHGNGVDLDYYIERILSLHSKRKLIDISNDIQKDVFGKESIYELHRRYTQKMAQLIDGKSGDFESSKEISENFEEEKNWLKTIDERIYNFKNNIDNFNGFRTGYPSLDKLIGGFGLGKSTIIGARSGSGKTTLLVNLLLLNKEQYPDSKVGFFSLEMSSQDIFEKMAAAHMQVPFDRLSEGNLSPDERLKAQETYEYLKNSGIYLYDKPNLTISNAYNVLRRAILNYDLQMVFIDYLTILKPDKATGNIYVDTDTLSKGIQSMAREFNIPFVTLAQLSRKSQDRADTTPNLSDLRNSGSIEEDADNVIMIHRPPLINGQSSKLSQLHVVKSRHRGFIGRIDLTFEYGRLYEALPIEEEMKRIQGEIDE